MAKWTDKKQSFFKYMFTRYGGRYRKECDVIVWLHFYDCLNTIFSQHTYINTLVSLAEAKSEHQWLNLQEADMEKDIGKKALYFLSPLSEHILLQPSEKKE